MISKHSAHLTPLPFGIRTWLWRYTYLLLLISMLWLRKAIFESKGDKLSSSAECRIRTQRVSETQSPADWMPADKPTELSRIKLIKKLELDSPSLWSASIQPTWLHCHLAFAHGSGDIYIFVVVKFDALAQSNDFRIERRQVVFLCWMQDSYPEGLWNPIPSRLNACWQTDWAIEDQAKKNFNSTARPYNQQAFSPPDPTAIWHSHLALAIYIFVVVNFDALASDFRIERRQVVFLCGMQDSNPEGLWNPISSRLNACWQTDWAIEDQAKKTWTRQIEEHTFG